MKTLVVNLFAGPGAGKTTCAWAIAAELKKLNINTEYVSEYAKELVWDKNYEALARQEDIFKEQAHRINRLIGKVEVIVTDSPILLSEIYGKNNSDEFSQRVWDEHNSHENFNLFINRGKYYEQAGRIQNLSESKQIDNQIKNMLREHNIYFGTYYHQTLPTLVANIVSTLHRIQAQDRSDSLCKLPKKPSLDSSIKNAENHRKNACENSDITHDKDINFER